MTENIIKISREENGWFHIYLDNNSLFCSNKIEEVCQKLCKLVRGLEK